MRDALKSIASSTRSAILTNGMLPPNPKSLRSNHSVPSISLVPCPSRSAVQGQRLGF